MSPSHEVERCDEPEFKWLKKRGVGGKKKDVQFYESFSYDGVVYALYDSLYMYKEGEPYPYIGKLVKIWENADKSKKIKVHWFFRPSEVAYYLKDVDDVLENELFFASGEGIGVANLNPLEAIAGKCNVLCISTDNRNLQPSAEELQMADYVFYRIFDVKSYTISDQMGDIVGGLEVKFIFNRRESVSNHDIPKLDSSIRCEAGATIAFRETMNHSGKNRPHEINNVKPDECGDGMLPRKASNANQAQVKQEPFSVSVDQIEERIKFARKSGSVDDAPSKRIKFDGAISSLKDEDTNGMQRDVVASAPSSNAKLKLELVEHYYGSEENVQPSKNASFGDEKLDFSKETPRSRHIKDGVRLESNVKLTQGLDVMAEKLSETIVCGEKSRSTQSKDSGTEKHKNGGKKVKFNDSVKITMDNDDKFEKKLKEKTCVSEANSSSPHVTPYDSKEKSKLGKGFMKEYGGEKVGKVSRDNLPITTLGGDDGKAGSKIFEVTRRPIVEKSNWIKLPWEERLKDAYDQGRLIVLQNLDIEYTSGEVEDIIWCAFKEQCTAKMVQHTAISNPFSGQAFVIFKTRDAAEGVVKKLNGGCLMLPNQRPLIACSGHIPKLFEKQTTFIGHLAIDKARRQIQRELKEAVSTSHYSQNNTIEYEMALAWCFLQAKSDKWWEKLYQQQRRDVKKLVDDLKSKSK